MLIDEASEKLGGKRLAIRGTSNAAKGNMFSDFEIWSEGTLWPAIHGSCGRGELPSKPNETSISMDILTEQRATRLTSDVRPGLVINAKHLTAAEVPEKRHLEIQLPSGMSYNAGDYLAVLPMNPNETVHRVLTRYSLPWDAIIRIKDGSPNSLPVNTALSIYDVLKGYVELSQPATRSVSFQSSRRDLHANKPGRMCKRAFCSPVIPVTERTLKGL